MAKDKCPSVEIVKQLEKKQATLDFNQTKVMEVLEKIEKKVDSIYKHIFEWWMAKDYVSREIFNNTISVLEQKIVDKDREINELKSNQNRVAWFIIFAVLSAVIGLVIIPRI